VSVVGGECVGVGGRGGSKKNSGGVGGGEGGGGWGGGVWWGGGGGGRSPVRNSWGTVDSCQLLSFSGTGLNHSRRLPILNQLSN